MKTISVCVLVAVALAAVSAYPSDTTPAKNVVVHTVPSRVTETGFTGAMPIPVSVVLAEAMKKEKEAAEKDDSKTISKRWWHEEETTPAPHGWGWGWPAPAPHQPATTPAPAPPAMSGPWAFQLGAYYNPLLPAPVENPPAYPNYPAAPMPAYVPGNTYSPSPMYSNPAMYAPSSYSPAASPY